MNSFLAVAGAALLVAVATAHDHTRGVIELHGSGTTNPSKYFWRVMDKFEEESREPLRMTYRAVGSSTGQKELVGSSELVPANDFGAGDIPMSKERYDKLKSAGVEMLHVPFLLGAISFFHSVPGATTGKNGLNVTGCLLAKIFQRDIKTWDHSDILDLNPQLLTISPGIVGKNIKVVHRTLGSSSTSGASNYMAASCPDWKLTAGSVVNWPEDTIAAQGSGGVANYIAENQYAIGYLDAGHGHSLGFAEIELQNKDGKYLTSKDADIGAAATVALARGVLPSRADADWSAVNLYDLPGPSTWPITMVSYFYLRKDVKELGESGTLLKAFVEYVLSEEGQDMLQDFSFVKIPAELLEYNTQTLSRDLVVAADARPWIVELVDTTQPIVGAADHVISGKRQSYAVVERNAMLKEMANLKAKIEAMENSVAMKGDDSKQPTPAATPAPTAAAAAPVDSDSDDGTARVLGGVAIALSVVGILIGLLAFKAANKTGLPNTSASMA